MQDLPMSSLSVLEHLIFDDHKNEFVSRKQYEEQYENSDNQLGINLKNKFISAHKWLRIVCGLGTFPTHKWLRIVCGLGSFPTFLLSV